MNHESHVEEDPLHRGRSRDGGPDCRCADDRGYEVRVAHNGGMAWMRSSRTRRPGAGRYQHARHVGIRAARAADGIEPRFEHMPFVFLTALADRENELKGWRLGADDYVTKPVDFDVLGAVIAARLARVARMQIWPKLIDLGKREVETLTWAARGKTSAEIAQILGLSKRTVDFHIDNARVKLVSPLVRSRHQGRDGPADRAVAAVSGCSKFR